MSEESAARPVRVARPESQGRPRAIRVAARSPPPAEPAEMPEPASVPAELRRNRAATGRAVRLATLYAVGIAVVYVALAIAALAGPAGGSSGSTYALLVVGALAVPVAVAGVLFTLGAAPRSVELGDAETVVVGRFGRRYRFPGREQLRPVVLRRFPAGWLAPIAVESVELGGGSTRRSFLLDEGLLAPERPDEGAPSP